METDAELETWRREWQRNEVILLDLKQRVERETRNLRRSRYAEIAVTVVFGGSVLAWALVSWRPIAAALAIGIWFFIAVAWVVSIRLSRDVLTPSAATTTAFLELSIRRCRNRLHGLTAQCVLFVMIFAFDLVWIYHYQGETRTMEPWAFLTAGRMLPVWSLTAMVAAAAIWYRRQLNRELQNLLNLRHQLGDML
jgi:hypothetical protein